MFCSKCGAQLPVYPENRHGRGGSGYADFPRGSAGASLRLLSAASGKEGLPLPGEAVDCLRGGVLRGGGSGVPDPEPVASALGARCCHRHLRASAYSQAQGFDLILFPD